MDFSRYLGIPWVAGGRGFDGADCWGLVWLFYAEELGIRLDRYDDARGAGPRAAAVLIGTGSSAWHQVENPRPGDVAVLMRAGCASHVGIVAPRRHLLHVESIAAPSVLAPIDTAMKNRIGDRIYRWAT